MKQILLTLCAVVCIQLSLCSQPYLSSTTFIRTYTKVQLDSILDYEGLPSAFLNNQFSIDLYKMNYKSKDAFDTLVPASGLLIVPRDTCGLPIFCYSHGTTSKKTEVPSRVSGAESFIGMVMSSNGYITVMPDYLGLGDGPGLHPYQHAKTEAYSNVFMLKALKEYCAANAVSLNDQLFLSGYSQGGHASMATHRMIERDYATEFTVTASAPMSGAYDMDKTMVNVMLSDSPYAAPAYLPYLVISWNPIYNLYTSISDAFKSPYDTTLPPLFDGTRSLGYIEARMPNVPKLIFDTTELQNFTVNLSHPFRLALKDNVSYRNFVPRAPLRMYYCTADRQVSYLNALVAQDSLKAQGCTTCDAVLVNATLDHQDCAQYALLMAKSFMDSLKTNPCDPSSVNNIKLAPNTVSIYPNPSTDQISISIAALENEFELVISDMTGRIVYSNKNCLNQQLFNISFLQNGLYMASIRVLGQQPINKQFVVSR